MGTHTRARQLNVPPIAQLDGAALTLCLIDGDANFFAPEFVKDAEPGGVQAAQLLIRGLAGIESGGSPPRGAQTWALVILNKAAACARHVANGTCTAAQFAAFCAGFDGAFALFSILDAGTAADAADRKLKGARAPRGRGSR